MSSGRLRILVTSGWTLNMFVIQFHLSCCQIAISDVSCLEPCCEIDAAVEKHVTMLSHTYKNGLHDDQLYDKKRNR